MLTQVEVAILLRSFARAFDAEPPSVNGLTGEEALATYREFTAACMEYALQDERLAATLRDRLGKEALDLGRRVRRALPLSPAGSLLLARALYRGIGIELTGTLPRRLPEEAPGQLQFGPCSFSARYTPGTCWFMSAFDEGFLRGITGFEDARLRFGCRLTEGAPSCQATFSIPNSDGGNS